MNVSLPNHTHKFRNKIYLPSQTSHFNSNVSSAVVQTHTHTHKYKNVTYLMMLFCCCFQRENKKKNTNIMFIHKIRSR